MNHAAWNQKRSRATITLGAVLMIVIGSGLFYLMITGKTRNARPPAVVVPPTATSTIEFVARRLDGVQVPSGQEALGVYAVMVENHPAARPLSGPAHANVVIEAPVEGGITRFLLLFDATTTVAEIGPVRSSRPYYIDWAKGWNALYAHVGGSPEALQRMAALGSQFSHIDEFSFARFFWRSTDRFAPHNTYTNHERLTQAAGEVDFQAKAPVAWHFQDMATTTARGGITNISIPYGGNYNVSWKYDKERGVYGRSQAGRLQKDRDGTAVESENVIVIKTDSQVLDKEGRLRVRTVGSGEAIGYRDGNKYVLQWRRAQNEPMRFETPNGSEFLLTRGRTWIEVTTDDRVFAGLGQ